MEPFLKQVARYLHTNYRTELYNYWLVFPNKRTGIFFKKHLAELSNEPVFVPPFFSIDEFIKQFTPLEEIDQLGALFELYATHKNVSGTDDSFDEFYFWGEMLLNDFDDVDKYLVDAKKLYTNLLDLKEIDTHFILDDDTLIRDNNAINSFWETLFKTTKVGAKNFLKTWESLYPVYTQFRETLQAKNLGYTGLLYRDAVSQIEQNNGNDFPFKRVGFVGFNALTMAEEKIFAHLKKCGVADFFWDYSPEMLSSDSTRSGLFLRKYTKLFPGVLNATIETNTKINVSVTAVPSGSAQTSIAGDILNALEKPSLETALVLADESLLQTMLNSIPQNVNDLNVTMGYPLKNSQVSALLSQITQVQQRLRYQKGMVSFNYKMVLQLLSNNILRRVCACINSKKDTIKEKNLFNIPASFFKDDALLKLIFSPVEQGVDVLNYLSTIFEHLLLALNPEDDSDTENESIEDHIDTERELVYSVYTRLNRVRDLFMSNPELLPGRDLMFKLIKRMVDSTSIPFEGQPLLGLQLMGILETRNLEFKNLIITSANEGTLPANASTNSFIPYNLRKGYGLPTVEEHDAMYAYYFYRLLLRSENVHLIYDSTSQGVNTGEPSRYIYQLKYLSNIPITEQTVAYEVSLKDLRQIKIEKNPSVMQLLDKYSSGSAAISASSLNAYLDCSLKFYFAYTEQIREPDEMLEDIDARIFGNMFHEIMEHLYKRFEGQIINASDIDIILKDKSQVEVLVKQIFANNFFKRDHADVSAIKGKLLIYVKVLLKYTLQILYFDKKNTPFTYYKGEENVGLKHQLAGDLTVNLMAKIDRVDEKNGVRRIIDYKSGTINVNSKNQVVLKDLEELFKREKPLDSDQKAIFQTLFYAMLYAKNKGVSIVSPAILPIRKLFGRQEFIAHIFTPTGKELIYDDVADKFSENIKDTLEEIFNPSMNFTQTENIKNCEYCDFKNICGR